MKILIVGNNKPWSIERYFMKYLKELGANVYFYGSGDIVYNFHSSSILNKILFHSKIVTKYAKVNRGLLNSAREIDPDIIWIFKGMEIFPDTLQNLKDQGFILANFNPDHPFIIPNKGSGNKNVSKGVPFYDVHFCYQFDLKKQIKDTYNIPTVFLPFAYESEDVNYINQSEIKEIKRICFQGNPDEYRAIIIKDIASAGLPIDVYGRQWHRFLGNKSSNINCFPIADRKLFWKLNQQYRVQLNLFRKYNYGSHNMRTFEIPVVGGIQLTPYSNEQAALFHESKEIFFFANNSEMIEKCRMLLNMTNSEADIIRAAARSRSLKEPYSFKDRAQLIYETFKSLTNGNCIV
jgi:spore maturation protein CgeB